MPVATDQQDAGVRCPQRSGRLRPRARRRCGCSWECCGIPDYRDISPAQHGEIVTRIYLDLRKRGRVDADWIAEQVRFCDNVVGDIDTLSNRIRQIRTWTFVANRKNWLEDPAHWREKTRDIEDRLSDALHERLTQRFVDRRTSVLMRHLRDKHMVSPEINDRGEISLEGHLIGSIEGFRFTLARSEGGDAKGVATAATQVVAPEIAKRAERVAGAPNEEFVLATDGYVRWRGQVVANLAEGDTLFAPRLIILADESLSRPRSRARAGPAEPLAAAPDQHRSSKACCRSKPLPISKVRPAASPSGSTRTLASCRAARSPKRSRRLDQDVRGKLQQARRQVRRLSHLCAAEPQAGAARTGADPLCAEARRRAPAGRFRPAADRAVGPHLVPDRPRSRTPSSMSSPASRSPARRAVRVDILERLADIIRPLIALNPVTHQGAIACRRGRGQRLPRHGRDDLAARALPAKTSPRSSIRSAIACAAPPRWWRLRWRPTPCAPTRPTPPVNAAAAGRRRRHQPAAMRRLRWKMPWSPTPPPISARRAPPVVATAAEPLAPAEPEFDEIWFPAGRRPDNARHEQPRREPPAPQPRGPR